MEDYEGRSFIFGKECEKALKMIFVCDGDETKTDPANNSGEVAPTSTLQSDGVVCGVLVVTFLHNQERSCPR